MLIPQPSVEEDVSLAAAMIETNFTGQVTTLLALGSRMKARGSGAIVVLSSVAAVRPRKFNSVYGAAKAGLDAFARGYADSLHGTGVRVLMVRPGFVTARALHRQAPPDHQPRSRNRCRGLRGRDQPGTLGGFRQYQYVLPFGQEQAARRSFEMVSALPAPSFVTVLKRFGDAGPGLLSFPRPGWTLALDFPARTPALLPLLDRLDRLVMEHGGRVYLAKDSHVARRAFEAMYPRVEEFRKIRAEIGPARILASDLSRRLGL